MKTRRPLSINNSLVHGICNYKCRLCGINKQEYDGPREFQSYIITKTLIHRIHESAKSGCSIRYVTNAGDGEPTLHPEFSDRMAMFGRMLREWNISNINPPEVSVVTNGSRLMKPGIIDTFLQNHLTMIISLPTLTPDAYGLIMSGKANKGTKLLNKVLPGVAKAMALKAEGTLADLFFHISPPEMDIIRQGFQTTLNRLTCLADKNSLRELQLVLFPAPSNRSGLVHNSMPAIDMYKDLFKRYNGKTINGVTIRMKLVIKRFFPSIKEIGDLIKNFSFPCLWNANFFITAAGSSICCNDQSARNIQGNILHDSIDTLMKFKEQFRPGLLCKTCNQSPYNMRGSTEARLFSLVVKSRLILGKNTTPQTRHINRECIPDEPRLVENLDDIQAAFRLIYKKYMAAGFQEQDPSRMRINIFNLLPVSYMLNINHKGTLQGTLSLIRECHGQLPLTQLFFSEIEQIRRDGSIICELSSLATVGESYRKSKQNLLSLFRSAFILANDILGITDFCVMINPTHCQYYEKELLFKRRGRIRQYKKVNGAPAVFMWLDLRIAEELFKEKNPNLYPYFFKDSRKEIGERLLNGLLNHGKIFEKTLIEYLQKNKANLLDDLTIDERKLLDIYYGKKFDVASIR